MTRKRAVVLLVEDSPADQLTVERAIEDGRVNCDLIVVENGEEALKLLRRNPPYDDKEKYPFPDLILLDINMPIMDGPTALSHIRQDSKFHNLPVVMLTTSDADSDVERSYAAGANAYITKPVQDQGFIDAVRKIEGFWFELVTLPPVGRPEFL